MKNNCCICGKPILAGTHICVDCIAGAQEGTIEYKPDMIVLMSSELSTRLYALYQKYFSRPEIESAFQAYSKGLSDCH